MKKTKKSLKGMTLYEMIISIAIFAIMCLILVGVGVHIDRTTKATNNMKSKLTTESQFAANKIVQPDFIKSEVTITVDCGGSKVDLKADKYNTETAFTGDKDKNVDDVADPVKAAEAENQYNGNLNLEFVKIQPK